MRDGQRRACSPGVAPVVGVVHASRWGVAREVGGASGEADHVEEHAVDSWERNVSYTLMALLFGPVYVVTAILIGILTLGTENVSQVATFVLAG